ncbi:MAG TPA: sigma-70 family RNA polymerase sigma factor [Candidatus Acidoferrales bacterium]|nr:sigma-70 family RNA polymerase sigma factor [Candidatus Acidoferrales bacterium]
MPPMQQYVTTTEDSFRKGRNAYLSERPAAPINLSGDTDLVAAARRGDRSAFGRLYDRFAPMVHGIVLSRVSAADADDLVHDVFLAALRQLHSLRNPSAFGGWLAQIARNRARDYYRRGPQKDEVELPGSLPGAGARDTSAGAEANVALRIIQEMPEAYRETLLLRLVEGMTGPEIAARTGLAQGSVRVNLHRGMRLLRERLSQ